MLGFIGVGLGLLSLHIRLVCMPTSWASFRGVLLGWIGIGLTLTSYGAGVYGLSIIGPQGWQGLLTHRCPRVLASAERKYTLRSQSRPSLCRKPTGSKRSREWSAAGVCWIRRT